MTKKIQKIFLAGLLISSTAVFSQIKEEKLILDKKREPEIKKIEKKKTSVSQEKNYPPKEKKTQDSLNLKYDITDVPTVSDFKTSTIQGSDISPKLNANYQNNYVRFGLGNYGKILADANISTTLQNKTEVGADVHFLSTTGLKKDYDWKSASNNATIGAFLNSYGEKGKFNLNAEYGLNDYNYYGIYALKPASDIDLQQKLNQFKINGNYDFYSNEILDFVSVKSNFLSDHFSTKESSVEAKLGLAKNNVEISALDGVSLNANLETDVKSLKTDFALLDKNSSNFFNVNLFPKLTFHKGNSYLILGVEMAYLNGKNENLVLNEEKTNKTYWFPQAELLFSATDEFKFYAGINGGLQLNSYAKMLQQNPYLVSDQFVQPTNTKYHFYFGLKGDIRENMKYDISAGFAKKENILFFEANDLFDYNNTLNRSAYNFANTFSAVYDNGTVSSINGSLQFFPIQNLVLDAEINFAKYSLDNYATIYNKPLVNATLGAKYTMLNQKLLLGFKGILATDKTTNSFNINNSGINPLVFVSQENTNDKVGGFADLNLSAEYKIHKNFSIFALGNNLLNTKYESYKGYKVLGTQILGGVKISF